MSNTDTMISFKSSLSINPISGFENLLEINRKGNSFIENEEVFKILVSYFLLSFCERSITNGHEEEEAIELLRGHNNLANRNLISSYLSRLFLENNTNWLLDNPWRQQLISIFDEELQELYRERRFDAKLMAHEKIIKIRDIVLENEQHFNTALSMLTSFDQINTQRQRLMKALKNRISFWLIVPFLPSEYESQLSEAYKRTEYYIEKRDDLSVVDAFNNSKDELYRIINFFKSQNTIYSNLICERVITKLLNLIETDFYSNPAAQSADILLETRDSKKYPFHLLEQTINLGFVIKNQGAGYAYETKFEIISDECLEFISDEIIIGRIAPNATHNIEIPAIVKRKTETSEILIQTSWKNFDDSNPIFESIITVNAQRSDINWEELAQTDPYSLEPVIKEQDLVGRRDLLNRLLATVKAQSVGSAVLRGQKRVGKTSLARAIESNLKNSNFIALFLESGDYVEADPSKTISRLSTSLCKKLKTIEPRISGVSMPEFTDALAPLAEYLDDVNLVLSGQRIVFILDEFDELPLDLYARGAVGDSFFLTLRSISSRTNIGFIIVGSEKITHVLDCQGDKLNKWNIAQVDYFTRESDWSDFKELWWSNKSGEKTLNDKIESYDEKIRC